MGKSLRVLILEDCPADADLMVRELCRAGFAPEWQRAESEQGLLAKLTMMPEIILSDYSMPGFNGLQALRCVRQQGLRVPFIIVSGATGEEIAVAAMQEGIDDYLLKDRLARLGPAVGQVRLRRNDGERIGELI